MIEVTKEQFYDFIEQQEQVTASVSGISEPPTRLYTRIVNDKREPIGAVTLFETYKKESEGGRYPYVWQHNVYRLIEDYNLFTLKKEQLESVINDLQGIKKVIDQNLRGVAHRDEGLLFDALIKTSDLLRQFEHAAKNTDKRTDG